MEFVKQFTTHVGIEARIFQHCIGGKYFWQLKAPSIKGYKPSRFDGWIFGNGRAMEDFASAEQALEAEAIKYIEARFCDF